MSNSAQAAQYSGSNTDGYDLSAAFRPDMSVFVSANAGAGKTSLLTGRVLSLLLHGVPPSKILCLTFTNAAAAEMSGRVLSQLGAWVMAESGKLTTSLTELTGHTPSVSMVQRARSLFATVLEAPEGIRIQTIHGFSQSLLRRFPLEADISPHFTIMDSRTEQELLKEARMRLLILAQTEDPALQESLLAIASGESEYTINKLLTEIIKAKALYQSLFTSFDAIRSATRRIGEVLEVVPGTTLASLIANHFTYDADTLARLRALIPALLAGKVTDQKTGEGLAAWLEQDSEGRTALVALYTDVFLTQKGEERKKLSSKGVLSDSEAELLLAEQQRMLRFCEARKAMGIARDSAHMLRVAEALLSLYEDLKNARVQMDYDDLILTARDLLQRPGIAPWVLFKLDGGIDHVLIDEAQDTSPVQWQIVTALTQDFFAGMGRSEQERSLFVVGDEKQSIFSFQGADPVALGRMQHYFTRRIEDAGKLVKTLSLSRSYRSARELLVSVDTIFASEAARSGLSFDDKAVAHIPTRLEHPGLVELWPLITKPPKEKVEEEEGEEQNGEEEEAQTLSLVSQLSYHIADQIKSWLDEGMILPSRGRNLQPGDIMILLRKRVPFADSLVRALKRRGVPVAGLDRMKLGDNLAVRDLIALGQCLLLPEDDLMLACLLKSPIFNISEEDLFALAWGRGKASLWQRLRTMQQPALKDAFELLSELRGKADFTPPYELYSYVLDTLGARRRFTGRMGEEYHDPMDEFLDQAMLYERSHTPSLQGFIHWLDASESEIKRDMEQAHGKVRIMTVHAAKGLQAPLVILPDTVSSPSNRDTLLWLEEEHKAPLPFWPRSRKEESSLCRSLRQQKAQAELHEYQRQLYVALTRAEDQLYICGICTGKDVNAKSWYHHVRAGLKSIAKPFDMDGRGEGLRLGIPPAFRRMAEAEPPEAEAFEAEPSLPHAGFDFLHKPAPVEPTPPQPLIPSRMTGEEEPAAASPLSGQGRFYQRGTLIHRLLQYLPDVPEDKRADAAANIAGLYRSTLPAEIRESCIRETLHIISHPPFAFLFGEGSLAEAPLAGCIDIDGKSIAIAGQIDRLYISKSDVWIIDFKSGRAAPDDAAHIPAMYLRQMRLYELLMRRLYPEKQIHCGLLWTADPRLTVIGKPLLDEVDLSTYI